MTKIERAAERSRLLALAAPVNRNYPLAMQICAVGIRENLTHPRGSFKRAQEAATTLERVRAIWDAKMQAGR